MDRAELLDRIASGKAKLDRALAAIPAERMETSGDGGAWSPKDQLSHLAAWHEIVLCRMRGQLEETIIDLPAGYAETEIDDVNRFLFERDRGRGIAEARDALERTYREVVDTLEALPDEALHRTFRPDLPERLLVDTIAGNTYEHYEEHVPMVRAAGD
jgi:hypothetical protein